jgi:hypothetical protein
LYNFKRFHFAVFFQKFLEYTNLFYFQL